MDSFFGGEFSSVEGASDVEIRSSSDELRPEIYFSIVLFYSIFN